MVYVSPPKSCRPRKGWTHSSIVYMTATSDPELDAFAKKLKLSPNARVAYGAGHRYNLSAAQAARALEEGAVDLVT